LYLTQRGHLADTKKVHLDEFVKTHRDDKTSDAVGKLTEETSQTLDRMAAVFVDADFLLRSVGTTVLYYFLFLEAGKQGWINTISRAEFEAFDILRVNNRVSAEQDVTNANFSLLEYDRLTQSPNDAVALRFRYAVLRQYIGPETGRPELVSTT